MKNLLVFASILLASAAIVVSCSKDELIDTKQVSLEEQLLKVDLDETINNFTNEYAYFESDEALRSFFSQYQNSSFEAKKELTEKVTYLTFDKHLDAIYEGMNDLTTRDAFVNYVNNYADFMEIKLMSNGEEEVVEKEISRHPIAPFLNIDRIIKVGEEYRKYIGEFYIASENYADLAGINSTADMEKSKLEYKQAVSFQSGLLDKGPGDFFDEEFNDNRWCKDDRKVELLADLSIAQTWEPNIGTYIYDAFPYVGVTAKRKGIPCIWYPYKTNITWDNFHVEYIMDGNPKVTWTEGYMFDYAKRIEPRNGDSFLGDYNPTFEWKKIRSTVGSQGMGTKTLDIDEVW